MGCCRPPDGTPRPVSFNHYAFGCVDDWLYRRVAGLQPTAPGWVAATIEPDLDSGLAWVRAHVGTPFGRLAVEWERVGATASVTVTVPDGASAVLVAAGRRTLLPAGTTSHSVRL